MGLGRLEAELGKAERILRADPSMSRRVFGQLAGAAVFALKYGVGDAHAAARPAYPHPGYFNVDFRVKVDYLDHHHPARGIDMTQEGVKALLLLRPEEAMCGLRR